MAMRTIPGATGGVTAADGSQAVMVPLNQRALVPVPAERVRRIREHLVRSLRDLRTLRQPEGSASPLRPEPLGFAGTVVRAACALCQGKGSSKVMFTYCSSIDLDEKEE